MPYSFTTTDCCLVVTQEERNPGQSNMRSTIDPHRQMVSICKVRIIVTFRLSMTHPPSPKISYKLIIQESEAFATWLLRFVGSMWDLILDPPGFVASWVGPGQEKRIVNGDGTWSLPILEIPPFHPRVITYQHASLSPSALRKIVWKRQDYDNRVWTQFFLSNYLSYQG